MVTITNLSKKFGTKKVLNDINLNFEKGTVYGIVGKNGAGKTTLFRCISGLEKHTGIIESEYGNLKNNLGLLETDPLFMSRITGWEYLKLICMARNIEDDDFESQNIFDLPLDQYAENYSTGMKKKLALMGVLFQKNDVFILDEPFNGVDIQSNIIIVALIKELKKKNKTIIISSHILSTLSENCDKIFLIDDGQIIKSYNPDTFFELEHGMNNSSISDKIRKLNI